MARFAGYQDALVFAFAPPAICELGNATGFDVQLQDRAGLGHDGAHGGPQPAPGRRVEEPGADRGAPGRPRGRARSTRSTSIRRRPRARAVDPPTSTRRCPRPGAAPTSTTSSIAAASSASSSRPTRPSACSPRISAAGTCATATARWCPSRRSRPAAGSTARRKLDRFNGFPTVEIQGEPAPGHSTGDGDGGDGAPDRGSFRPGIGRRMDRPVLRGAAVRRPGARCSTRCRCWSCSSAWPRSTRAGRSRSRSCSSCRSGVLGAVARRRAARARRTTSTSRSACSRPSAWRPRTRSSSSSSPRRTSSRAMGLIAAAVEAARHAPAADPHDVARVHARRPCRSPISHGAGSGGQNADRHRDRRRDAGGDVARRLLHARVLRLSFTACSRAAASRSSRSPRLWRHTDAVPHSSRVRAVGAALRRLRGRGAERMREPRAEVPRSRSRRCRRSGRRGPRTGRRARARPGRPRSDGAQFYADDRLQSVVALSLANNRDLRIATLNIERARALYRIQRADQLPTIAGRRVRDGAEDPGVALAERAQHDASRVPCRSRLRVVRAGPVRPRAQPQGERAGRNTSPRRRRSAARTSASSPKSRRPG